LKRLSEGVPDLLKVILIIDIICCMGFIDFIIVSSLRGSDHNVL
jgi:hypothetical protein